MQRRHHHHRQNRRRRRIRIRRRRRHRRETSPPFTSVSPLLDRGSEKAQCSPRPSVGRRADSCRRSRRRLRLSVCPLRKVPGSEGGTDEQVKELEEEERLSRLLGRSVCLSAGQVRMKRESELTTRTTMSLVDVTRTDTEVRDAMRSPVQLCVLVARARRRPRPYFLLPRCSPRPGPGPAPCCPCSAKPSPSRSRPPSSLCTYFC